jgi:hypothetical protein
VWVWRLLKGSVVGLRVYRGPGGSGVGLRIYRGSACLVVYTGHTGWLGSAGLYWVCGSILGIRVGWVCGSILGGSILGLRVYTGHTGWLGLRVYTGSAGLYWVYGLAGSAGLVLACGSIVGLGALHVQGSSFILGADFACKYEFYTFALYLCILSTCLISVSAVGATRLIYLSSTTLILRLFKLAETRSFSSRLGHAAVHF